MSEYKTVCETHRAYSLNYNSGGILYVVSNLDLLPVEYDPMPCMPKILMALLQIGNDFSRGQDISLAVQAFCAHYGMLDFRNALVQKVYDDRSVKFYPDNVLGMKAATARQREAIFDPFPMERRRQMRRSARTREPELPLDETGEPVILRPDYYHCEAVDWYGLYGQQIYALLRRAQSGEAFTLVPGNAELRYKITGGGGQRRWYFDSLKSACDAYLLEMLTSHTPAIRLCKRCGKPLLTNGTRMKYCSASCRNVANVTNSRKRKSAQ